MAWTDLYRSKLTTADAALAAVRSGQRVFLHQGCAKPDALLDALTRRAPELRDIEIVHLATAGQADYTNAEFEGRFRHAAFFIAKNTRQAVRDGRADYIPIFIREIEGLFTSGAMPLDVALIQCTPPDDYGYLSLGPSVDIALTAARCARTLVVQVNDRMPRTMGNTFLHVSEPHAIVEHSQPLPEFPGGAITDTHRAIARHIAAMIPDGATLQAGIGAIPDAVFACLANHKDLGIHTEMLSDSALELIASGAVNNRRKTIHPDKALLSFVLGTQPLFDFIHNNPIFEFRTIAYTNDPFLIGRNDSMVAINAALQIDLTGQVCSDSIGCVPYSGVGGQVDFIRGAALSKGGVPIIALPSTAKNGTVSRIAPALTTGAGVVTTRADVRWVVTEFGAVNLHGRNLRQRAEALISIAHPSFQAGLEHALRRNPAGLPA
ncbi:MAG: acetyl-CoA hydrolase/transferase family protein [Bryobacteraceae bacterium]|nr:acetyl-CoA hydrolase/transferase family protein [Bryobacteraceae bacterium]